MVLSVPSVARVQVLGIEAGCTLSNANPPGDDIGGIGAPLGARVSALSVANQVLVSSTLRDLVIRSSLEFDDRGSYELKGVPGQWRVFAVASA
jgi:class 3 adenylate cyclase